MKYRLLQIAGLPLKDGGYSTTVGEVYELADGYDPAPAIAVGLIELVTEVEAQPARKQR